MTYEEQSRIKLTRAKIRMLLENPFFGTLVMYLPVVPDFSVTRTDTNGELLFYNPQWINSLSEEESAAVVCHTVLHCALGHLWRRSFRKPERWDAACDYVVNLVLEEAGYKLPAGLFSNKLYRGKSAEEVYSILSEKESAEQLGGVSLSRSCNNGEIGNGSSGGEGEDEGDLFDQHEHWEDITGGPGARSEELQRLWTERVTRAVQIARSRGDLPGALERLVGELLRPEKDWRQILAEFLVRLRADYSWLPPDRRLIPYNILVPDLGEEEERLEDIVVAVDTSGSVENAHLQRFLSEVRGIISSFYTINSHLVFCDSKIQSWHNLINFTDVIPTGGGGTDTRPVFDEIIKRGINPSALVYYTDGITIYPTFEPPYPVLWVLTKEHTTPPWGRCVVLRTV
ncbi:vWA domain-containing protein [Desulfolucanica intricata]|uniref:vWA domain-containing protein n=1 Tax=Desulfolucanica intricata TaxID=1285191 RepID=UPI000831EA20|nr:VWA-like domain-containing protein [Desulfolucanica intricata]